MSPQPTPTSLVTSLSWLAAVSTSLTGCLVCIYLTTAPNGLPGCRRGCMVGEGELPGADGINGTMKLWTDASHTRSVNVTCGTAPYICKSGASVSNFQGFFPPSSNASQRYPYGGPGAQSVDNMYANGARHSPGSNGGPISMFSGDQLPVKRASEFQSTDPLPSLAHRMSLRTHHALLPPPPPIDAPCTQCPGHGDPIHAKNESPMLGLTPPGYVLIRACGRVALQSCATLAPSTASSARHTPTHNRTT
eukprot:COSAG01_NODE_20858_length_931_cov_1.753606_1_plen_249_part_00